MANANEWTQACPICGADPDSILEADFFALCVPCQFAQAEERGVEREMERLDREAAAEAAMIVRAAVAFCGIGAIGILALAAALALSQG